MQLTAKVKNKSTVWSLLLKPRALDTVSYLGDYYINISGINSVPTVTGNWFKLTNNAISPRDPINKVADDITGTDPNYVINLSADGMPDFPILVSVYVDIDGSGDFEPLPPNNYNPITKILSGMSSPVDFPDQVVKILVL